MLFRNYQLAISHFSFQLRKFVCEEEACIKILVIEKKLLRKLITIAEVSGGLGAFSDLFELLTLSIHLFSIHFGVQYQI